MKIEIYQVLHVVSMVLLTAFVFQAFANPDPKNKRKTMMAVGILATTMLIGGFGLIAKLGLGFPVWIIVKLICWLGLASIGGIAYRKPEKIPLLTIAAIAFILIGVSAVYFRNATGGGFE